jgi:hypothetical protein
MENIFSSTDTKHLPQSVVDIKSLGGKSYVSNGNSTPVIEFEIPASLGFFNAKDVCLNVDFTYTDTEVGNNGHSLVRQIAPGEAQGIGGMIHQIDIYSIQDGVLLESIQDWETLNAAYISHAVGADEQMESGRAKVMSLTEGYTRDEAGRSPFFTGNSLPQTPDSLVAEASRQYITQKLCIPLRYSSLLYSDRVIPVSGLGGLRIRIQCNPVGSFSNIRLSDIDGKVRFDSLTGDVGFELDATNNTLTAQYYSAPVLSHTIPTGSYLTWSEMYTAIVAAFVDLSAQLVAQGGGATAIGVSPGAPAVDFHFYGEMAPSTYDTVIAGSFMTFFQNGGGTLTLPKAGGPVLCNGDATANGSQSALKIQRVLWGENDPKDLSTCPFVVGQQIYWNVGAGNVDSPKITGMSEDGTNIILQFADFVPSLAGGTVLKSRGNFSGVNYSLDNVSLTVPVITPPPSYVIEMSKAINSDEGLKMDIVTWALQRGNVVSGEAQTNILIPSVQSRAKGVITVAHQPANIALNTLALSAQPGNLNISNYYYTYHGIRNPEQGVDTSKLTAGKVSAELLWEQEKAFQSCFGEEIETFQGYENKYFQRCWFIGRSLSQMNGFFDARYANLNLTTQSTSAAGAVNGNWSIDNHLCAIHALVMKADGVTLLQ